LATGDYSVAQALWSFAHGMVILELDNRFPPTSDLDRTWAAGVAAFAELRAFAAMSDGSWRSDRQSPARAGLMVPAR
jgi:hypothetical protein